MQIYILIDRSGNVYGAVSDEDIADSWVNLAPDHGTVEVTLDDLTLFDTVREALELERE